MATDLVVRRVAAAVIASCIITIGVTAGVAAVPSVRSKFSQTVEPPGYAVGDRVDVPSAIYASSPYTLILFTSTTCGASVRSIAALTGMTADLRGQSRVGVAMVSGLEQRDEDLKLAERLGFTANQFFPLDLKSIRVKYVPSLVLVDREGRILMLREGAVTDQERAGVVREALSTAGTE